MKRKQPKNIERSLFEKIIKMCAAVKSDFAASKVKSKTLLGKFLSKMVSSNSTSLLQTDAVPNTHNNNSENQQQIEAIPSNMTQIPLNQQVVPTQPMELVQNNLNQNNQNVTIIQSQSILNINNANGLQFGNKIYVSGSNSRKNSHNESNEAAIIYRKSKSTVGKHYHFPRTVFCFVSFNKLDPNNKDMLMCFSFYSSLELMNCTDEIETQTMRIAAKYIGENWRMVFRDLEIPDALIAQIKEQYFHINVEEVIYQLLLKWKGRNDDPSIGKLSTILWKNESYDCVNMLKKHYKKLKRSQPNNDA